MVAIITRTLVEQHPLFKDKVYGREARSISPKNRTALTTVIALYDGLDEILKPSVKTLNFKKRRRPEEDEIASLQRAVEELYALLTKQFKPLAEMFASEPSDEVAGKYRNNITGGHLIFRPIGFTMIHRVLARLVKSGVTLSAAVKRVGHVPMMLDESPWTGLLWDAVNQRMITTPENQRMAERLAFHSVGGDLADYRTDPVKLRSELAGLLHRPLKNIILPVFVTPSSDVSKKR